MVPVLLAVLAFVQSAPSGFTVESYGGSVPQGTAMACAPDGRVFVAQLGGMIRVIKDGVLLDAPFHTLAVDNPAGTDRGLLGLCLDPAFASNGFVYAYFTHAMPVSHNCIRRLKAAGDVSDGTETVIVDLEPLGSDTMHNGGVLRFGPDGKLYVGVGDNAVPAFAQSLSSRFGKILRYNPDGTIPADNPQSFAGISGSPAGEFQAIWAVGLRQPFRIAFQPNTARLYINDVGADTWEEINEGSAGANYGWIGGDTDGARSTAPFTDPVFQYGHSGTTPSGKAVTGGVFYDPPAPQFPASFRGKYFFADFVAGFVDVLDPTSPGAPEPFLTGVAGIVDLQVGADGALYYLDYTGVPGVYRVSYPGGAQAPGGTSVAQSTGVKKDSKTCGATGAEAGLLVLIAGLLGRRRLSR